METQTVIAGNRLRAWRAGNGLTMQDVADLVGITESHVGRIERGERGVPPLLKVRIAKALGVPVSELFEPERLGAPGGDRQ